MKRIILIFVLLLSLTACDVPVVQDAVRETVTAIGRGNDGATLALTPSEVVFSSGNEAALAVVLTVVGEALTESEDVCKVIDVDATAVKCFPGDISETTVFNISGTNRLAWVSYFREGETFLHTFYVFD